ncbi:hypothetical protein V6N13_064870 [Hibiscus sabdariffa]
MRVQMLSEGCRHKGACGSGVRGAGTQFRGVELMTRGGWKVTVYIETRGPMGSVVIEARDNTVKRNTRLTR